MSAPSEEAGEGDREDAANRVTPRGAGGGGDTSFAGRERRDLVREHTPVRVRGRSEGGGGGGATPLHSRDRSDTGGSTASNSSQRSGRRRGGGGEQRNAHHQPRRRSRDSATRDGARDFGGNSGGSGKGRSSSMSRSKAGGGGGRSPYYERHRTPPESFSLKGPPPPPSAAGTIRSVATGARSTYSTYSRDGSGTDMCNTETGSRECSPGPSLHARGGLLGGGGKGGSLRHRDSSTGRSRTRVRTRVGKDALKMLCICHATTGFCLFQTRWRWQETQAPFNQIGKLVVSFYQFAREVDHGEVSCVNFELPQRSYQGGGGGGGGGGGTSGTHRRTASGGGGGGGGGGGRRGRADNRRQPGEAMQMLSCHSNLVIAALFVEIRTATVTVTESRPQMQQLLESCRDLFEKEFLPQLQLLERTGSFSLGDDMDQEQRLTIMEQFQGFDETVQRCKDACFPEPEASTTAAAANSTSANPSGGGKASQGGANGGPGGSNSGMGATSAASASAGVASATVSAEREKRGSGELRAAQLGGRMAADGGSGSGREGVSDINSGSRLDPLTMGGGGSGSYVGGGFGCSPGAALQDAEVGGGGGGGGGVGGGLAALRGGNEAGSGEHHTRHSSSTVALSSAAGASPVVASSELVEESLSRQQRRQEPQEGREAKDREREKQREQAMGLLQQKEWQGEETGELVMREAAI